jgi:hypothetical protein
MELKYQIIQEVMLSDAFEGQPPNPYSGKKPDVIYFKDTGPIYFRDTPPIYLTSKEIATIAIYLYHSQIIFSVKPSSSSSKTPMKATLRAFPPSLMAKSMRHLHVDIGAWHMGFFWICPQPPRSTFLPLLPTVTRDWALPIWGFMYRQPQNDWATSAIAKAHIPLPDRPYHRSSIQDAASGRHLDPDRFKYQRSLPALQYLSFGLTLHTHYNDSDEYSGFQCTSNSDPRLGCNPLDLFEEEMQSCVLAVPVLVKEVRVSFKIVHTALPKWQYPTDGVLRHCHCIERIKNAIVAVLERAPLVVHEDGVGQGKRLSVIVQVEQIEEDVHKWPEGRGQAFWWGDFRGEYSDRKSGDFESWY